MSFLNNNLYCEANRILGCMVPQFPFWLLWFTLCSVNVTIHMNWRLHMTHVQFKWIKRNTNVLLLHLKDYSLPQITPSTIWYTCTLPQSVHEKNTLLNVKLEKEEHIHTRSCISVLYFWDISANEHQKWKHKKWNNVSGFTWKNETPFFFSICCYKCIS